MKIKDVEARMRAKFPEAPLKGDDGGLSGAVWSVAVTLSEIREAASEFNAAGFFLESLTGLDFEDTFELVYHFNCFEPGSRAVVRVLCGHDQVAPSICDIFRGAAWLEREVHEFFGIKFSGNSDMRRLLLPEDSDYNPLRKTFGKVGAYHQREVI